MDRGIKIHINKKASNSNKLLDAIGIVLIEMCCHIDESHLKIKNCHELKFM
ncbi:hypothetical protein SASC256_09490 [Staphylococcus argenteus]|nr:hypothetical protein SA19061_20760 [Staphylococcus argenteus]GJF53698.1 hypothetical protein SA19088_04410 [Staphylococcus argenteus]GJF60183.1 hypothetical protein SA19105_16710 [Staphylococcus argenteus]GJF73339.1 hypothetical protein SA19202_19470 [Staphylococcus argenteus]GJF84915.1 hypothetical protein SA20015_06240 [Staphylococcus argenteus]